MPGQRTCAYNHPDGIRPATVGLVPGGPDVYKTLEAGLGSDSVIVTGLGGDAVRSNGYLNVQIGSYVLLVFVSGMNSDTAYAKATRRHREGGAGTAHTLTSSEEPAGPPSVRRPTTSIEAENLKRTISRP